MKTEAFSLVEKYKIIYTLAIYPTTLNLDVTRHTANRRKHSVLTKLFEKTEIYNDYECFLKDMTSFFRGGKNNLNMNLMELKFKDDRYAIDENGNAILFVKGSMDAVNALRRILGEKEL